MQKISTSPTEKLLLKFILKAFISTVALIVILSYLSAQIIYKLDLSTNCAKTISIFICLLSSAVISFASLGKIKNNGALMGIISEIPLIFYCLVNLIFNNHNFAFFIIKIFIIISTGALVGILKSKKQNNIKVKKWLK